MIDSITLDYRKWKKSEVVNQNYMNECNECNKHCLGGCSSVRLRGNVT